MRAILKPIESKKKWQYRKLIVEDERLAGWEINKVFGTFQSLPDVRLNEFGGVIVTFRKAI